MGNSLGRASHLNFNNFPYHIQLGEYVAIDATKHVEYSKGFYVRTVTVKYTIHGSTCLLQLTTAPDTDDLRFHLRDDKSSRSFDFGIKKAENDLLQRTEINCNGLKNSMMYFNTTETNNPSGGFSRTLVFSYGSRNNGGLLVTEEKIKNGDMYPYKVNVAHYCAASSGNMFFDNKIDIGLSIVLNIRRLNNRYVIMVEGPVRHPSSALFYMFEKVCKTGIWKPMACPHCADIQRHSESEDSDSSLPVPARLHGPKQNSTSVVANDGAVRGNYNGNLIVENVIYNY